MQFSPEVNWTGLDFLAGGVVLFFTALFIEALLRIFPSTTHRIIAVGVVLFALALLWAELAVGLFGSPFAGS
jgi:hypothetical protein